ncbi:Ppx/GppA family phosphatase [Salinibacterium sp. UTAS2018]|uniref:Ppx/GppA phosphatase family protein n=1 Tax=Salinibacterium sp. UTAS2018 TaxID=2508880 RepID=UPI00100962BC|nr:Ppx/GppA phosphatase family protein [Salinibacterium sp. UTAS2018]QAV71346.1 Ppx/GppA family phosphatase [Salinibacterium sp. UTAS2018]
MTRVAAIDCGTNSIRLLIADLDGHGGLTDVVRTLEVVRLGEGVDRTGMFSQGALDRTLAAVRRYAELCSEHGAERIRFVATSATRDAANRAEFTDAVFAILGVPVEVIPGTEEAALSFRGALTALPASDPDGATSTAPAPQHLVVDLGGGSTELVIGGHIPEAAYSMDVGCVRLAERNITTDPPSDAELDAIRSDVSAALDFATATVDLSKATEVIGVAGTVTTITAHALGLTSYDPVAISGSRLPLAVVLRSCEALTLMPRAEREALPYMHPGRVDVIASGAVIWATVLQRVADAATAVGHPLEWVTTSEHDILDGVALSLGNSVNEPPVSPV